MLMFLFDICSFLLTVASVIMALLGIGLSFTPTPHGGFIFLFLAFLLSPYGLQAVAGLLIEAVDGLGSSLRQFLVSRYCFGPHWPEANDGGSQGAAVLFGKGGIHLATTTLLKRHANEGETIAEGSP